MGVQGAVLGSGIPLDISKVFDAGGLQLERLRFNNIQELSAST